MFIDSTSGVVVEEGDWRAHQTVEDAVVQIDRRVDAHHEKGSRPNKHRHELCHNQGGVDDDVKPFIYFAIIAVFNVSPKVPKCKKNKKTKTKNKNKIMVD